MALKAILENLDGVDEALKPFYQEKDGKFSLQVEGMQHDEDVNGLKSALVKERENVGAYKKLGTPDEIRQQITDLQQKAKDAGKGGKTDEDHERIIQQMKDTHDAEKADLQKQITNMRRETTLGAVKAELAKAGVVAEGLDLLGDYAMRRIEFNDDGTPKVLAKDGSGPMIGSGANGGATLTDLAGELAGSIPHLVKDSGAGGSGKQPESKGGTPEAKTIKRSQFNDMSHVQRAEFSKSGGKVVDD